MYEKYFLVILNNNGESLYIGRYRTLEEIRERIKVPIDVVKSILYGKLTHPNYRIQRINN
jgi:hypothetical protein